MPRQTYLPGTWVAIVSERGTALLPGDVPSALVDRLWAVLDDGQGLGALLDALAVHFGASLASLPPFAVAIHDGTDVRLAARGPLDISVTEQGSSAVIVSGAGITTWSERVVPGAERLLFTSSDTALADRPHDDGAGWWGIRSGVVLAGAVAIDVMAASPDRLQTIAAAPEAVQVASGAADAPIGLSDQPDEPVQPASVEEVDDVPADDRAAADDAAQAVEDTRTDIPDEAYDHLWGATVVKSVESAAVRDLDDEDDAPAAASVPAAAPDPGAPPAPPAPVSSLPAPTPPTSTPPASADWTAPPATGLIDRVPGFPSAIGAPAPASADEGIDHDGLTVTVSEVDAMRRLGGATPGTGSALAAVPAAPPTSHGTLRLSTGDTVTLDRTIIVGRRPRANRVDADRMPTLITVPSPEQDISRNHLEVRIEGRHVLAVDLQTTNGSVLHRDGTPPTRLTPGEPVLLLGGDLIDFGDGVTLTFEGLS